jgi:cytochrome c1
MKFWRLTLVVAGAAAMAQQRPFAAPRVWNDRDLAEWATPLAKLNVRPGHLSESEYYAVPVGEWVRSYPVYYPGREPEGYWQMLQSKKPEPLIAPGARTEAEWIQAGRLAFDEMDVPGFRTTDPKFIARIRSGEDFKKSGHRALKDGTVTGWRWVPTSAGLALSISECAGCHLRVMPDGTVLRGAQGQDPTEDLFYDILQPANEVFLPGDSQAMATWRQYAVPWLAFDTHDSIKTMAWPDIVSLFESNPPGTIARTNGSPWHPTPIVDLIGIRHRKYLDYTATHKLRGPEDVARYAILVACCDALDFGPHHLLTEKQRIPPYRLPDELAFALAKYIYSLEPPPNPNARDARAAAGKKIFEREGCGGCHAGPTYGNTKLTLATGYTPPRDHPYRSDMLLMSVKTEPAAALETRKGTGLYKVPSLTGLWYRTLLSHDGSVASLEEWFDPARLKNDYVPKGFKGYRVEHRAVPGHEYGLNLPAQEKASLIAFLRTL